MVENPPCCDPVVLHRQHLFWAVWLMLRLHLWYDLTNLSFFLRAWERGYCVINIANVEYKLNVVKFIAQLVKEGG